MAESAGHGTAGRRQRKLLQKWSTLGFLFASALLIPLRDFRVIDPQLSYNHARSSFIRGDLALAEREAEFGYQHFRAHDLHWASRFQLLAAEVMLQRGMSDRALTMLGGFSSGVNDPDLLAQSSAIESVAYVRQGDFLQAEQRLQQSRALCEHSSYSGCGQRLQAGGILAAKRGNFAEARRLFQDTYAFAKSHGDKYLDASAALNLGWVYLQADRFEDALSYLTVALRLSREIQAQDLIEKSSGNLGWAYLQLGDSERALSLFLDAEKSASQRGNIRSDLGWTSTIGSTYRSVGETDRAAQYYRRALDLARLISSKEDITNSLEDLTHLSIDAGRLDDADRYLDELIREMASSVSRVDGLDMMLARGRIASAKHQVAQAEQLLRDVEKDTQSTTSMRLEAEYELAKLYEADGNVVAAARAYQTALGTYETARATLKSEESQLPFGANASRIYDSYIQLLMRERNTEQALAIADKSRAGTLEKGLDVASATSMQSASLNPRKIARRANATLLFYWLSEKQSYLWTITPSRIAAFNLPPRREIADRVKNYSKKILGLRDLRRTGDPDGESLYQSLVVPASELIDPAKQVIILADGELSQLNFETLLVPDRKSDSRSPSEQIAQVHYLVDDMTVALSPSLAMLQASRRARDRGGRILLFGDPVSPSDEFPSLPLSGFEMSSIQSHFAKGRVSVVAGQQATPATYLSSNPAQYSYIHFVSHAVANRIVPLDSAIVLSKTGVDENSFKLYARDIIQHPVDAKLVTISACYGNGTRFYAGEGLVGLSWAFLHAGAQRVIGALWEVSDESTPRLMDGLYRGIEEGNSPAVSLRNAKLALLHSQSRFSLPFYWASFQIYDRQ
jgi:CHAT domain-containing protein